MKYTKFQLMPVAISASFLILALIIFAQSTITPAVDSASSGINIDGYVCIYVNGEEVQCSPNLITNAGKNHTRLLLTSPVNDTVDGWLNGTRWIDLSDVSAAASADTVYCPGTINGSGLVRAEGTVRFETIESPSLAVGNYSISNQFTATATVANVQRTCLTNGTGGLPNITFAEDTFTPVTLNNGDTINITWFIGVS